MLVIRIPYVILCCTSLILHIYDVFFFCGAVLLDVSAHTRKGVISCKNNLMYCIFMQLRTEKACTVILGAWFIDAGNMTRDAFSKGACIVSFQ